jgi:site-specific DNA recombinase
VHVETVRAGELDLRTPAGRAVARTLGAWARYESEHRSERVRRKATELAKRGFPNMGGLRCFGYAKDKVTVTPSEAAILREAADRTLAGETLRAICVDLNRREIFTSTGHKWATPRLRALLLNPRIAGFLEHHTAGRVRGRWPAIISEDQQARLIAVLNDPARRTNPGAPRRRLLSGILRCGFCENKLSGQGHPANSKGRTAQYRCAPQEHRGCGKIAVSTHLIEPYVVEAVLSTIENLRVDTGGTNQSDDAEIDALASDQLQLRELASLYASRAISAQEWLRARAEIDDRIAQRNHLIADRTVDDRLRDLLAGPSAHIRDAWPHLPLEQQRSIIAAILDRVTINRAKSTRYFEPTRLDFVWRV